MKLTVATVVLNASGGCGLAALERCVRSVSGCCESHEHVIYDGGSTDGTLELLEGLAQEIPGLRLHSEPDAGIYDALNKCLRRARGTYFLVLGADDAVLPEGGEIDACLDLAERDGLDMLMSRVELDGGALSPLRPGGATCCHQGLLMRTESLRAQGGFDASYRIAADRKMYLRAHWDGLRMAWTDRCFSHYASAGVSSTSRGLRTDEFNRAFAEVLCREPRAYARAMTRGVAPVCAAFRLMRAPSAETRRYGRRLLFRRLVYHKFRTSGGSLRCLFGIPFLRRKAGA